MNAQLYPIMSAAKLPEKVPRAWAIELSNTKKPEMYTFIFSLSYSGYSLVLSTESTISGNVVVVNNANVTPLSI
jgi:hypothetical protein